MFEAALQKAIFDLLSDALSVPVYDDVPQPVDGGDSADFPYVTVGDTTAVPLDTDDSYGAECVATIHSWSRYRGRKEVKSLQESIYAAMNDVELTVSGFSLAASIFESSETLLDADGMTRHGVSQFRIFLST